MWWGLVPASIPSGNQLSHVVRHSFEEQSGGEAGGDVDADAGSDTDADPAFYL